MKRYLLCRLFVAVCQQNLLDQTNRYLVAKCCETILKRAGLALPCLGLGCGEVCGEKIVLRSFAFVLAPSVRDATVDRPTSYPTVSRSRVLCAGLMPLKGA